MYCMYLCDNEYSPRYLPDKRLSFKKQNEHMYDLQSVDDYNGDDSLKLFVYWHVKESVAGTLLHMYTL